ESTCAKAAGSSSSMCRLPRMISRTSAKSSTWPERGFGMLLQDTVSGSARKRPLATAIADGQEQLTYRQLEEVSNRIAQRLILSGCRPGDRVGILMAKSTPAIAGILGTLKAGAIYVPMDTSSPPIRLKRIIDVCE